MQTTLFPIDSWQRVCDDYYTTAPLKRTFSFFTAPLVNPTPTLELNILELFYIVSGKALLTNDKYLKSLSQRAYRNQQYYDRQKGLYQKGRISCDALCQAKAYRYDYVTIAGVFKGRRRYDCLASRSAYTMLNINELANMEEAFERLKNDIVLKPIMLFRSPNKNIVAIIDISALHQSYFEVVRDMNTYLAKQYQQTAINSRVTQYTCPTLVTYDPKAWLCPDLQSEENITLRQIGYNKLALAA